MGDDGPEKVSTDEIFKNKKVVLFAFPAAFTPTCSRQLPSFNAKVDEFKVTLLYEYTYKYLIILIYKYTEKRSGCGIRNVIR